MGSAYDIPWPRKRLQRLGEAIRDESGAPDDAPTYSEVLLWNNDIAVAVGQRIRSMSWTEVLDERTPEVTSRAKTIDTLRQKLQRDRTTPLQNVQDVAGVRFEAEMSLSEQDDVVASICREFRIDPEAVVKDLRQDAHSGYRAVHLWLRLPARVEVQVRTHLQGRWANMYEAAADFYGREIRYGALPANRESEGTVKSLQNLSVDVIAAIERDRDRVAQLQEENASILAELEGYDIEATIPTRIAEAMDVAADIAERREASLRSELGMVSMLEDLRRIFLGEPMEEVD